MRIISGIFRGKKIFQPIDNNTRPLKDLVKESIFNIIEHSKKFKINIKEAFVLDLFSGVGSFGLECLSRGSKFVTFVENYNGVLLIHLPVPHQRLQKPMGLLRQKNDPQHLDPTQLGCQKQLETQMDSGRQEILPRCL